MPHTPHQFTSRNFHFSTPYLTICYDIFNRRFDLRSFEIINLENFFVPKMTTTATILKLQNILPLTQSVKMEPNDQIEKPKRKRLKLDHLTQDEKLMRRYN